MTEPVTPFTPSQLRLGLELDPDALTRACAELKIDRRLPQQRQIDIYIFRTIIRNLNADTDEGLMQFAADQGLSVGEDPSRMELMIVIAAVLYSESIALKSRDYLVDTCRQMGIPVAGDSHEMTMVMQIGRRVANNPQVIGL